MGGWLENANMLIKKQTYPLDPQKVKLGKGQCGTQFNLPLTLTKQSHHSSTTNPDSNLNYNAPSVHTEEDCVKITSTVSFNAKRHKTIYVLKLQDSQNATG